MNSTNSFNLDILDSIEFTNVTNLTNTNKLTLLCPNHTKTEEYWIKEMAFWLDGVTKTIVAIIGIFLNSLAGYILIQPKMKNSFNMCLVALNIIDTIFLAGSVSESLKLR